MGGKECCLLDGIFLSPKNIPIKNFLTPIFWPQQGTTLDFYGAFDPKNL